ncbi:sulfotransferase family protein [Agaribacterium sp. ZY112]|uniref:sulfotransferase family protein n=1 Tax=Agaribacterium sp. ZY112 TaxID=3233574 RepID=UPI003526C073
MGHSVETRANGVYVNLDVLLAKYCTHIPPEELDLAINISKRYGYLFISTPKSGCSSVISTLQKLELQRPYKIWRHPIEIHDKSVSPLCGAHELVDFDRFLVAQPFTFTFVRNPYTRVLSAYLEKICGGYSSIQRKQILLQLGHNCSDDLFDVSFVDFLRAVSNQPVSTMDVHWMPQYYVASHDRMRFDFVGRLESMDRDFRFVLSKICNDFEQYITCEQRHGKNANDKISRYYTDEAVSLVKEIYAVDFKHFGYSLELPITAEKKHKKLAEIEF